VKDKCFFANAAVADPCCLTKQKSQPTLRAFVTYLPTWRCVRHYLVHTGTFL